MSAPQFPFRRPAPRRAPRGQCRVCPGEYALKADGTLRGHVPYGKHGGQWCFGSGNMPRKKGKDDA